jgi:hypothetical protein
MKISLCLSVRNTIKFIQVFLNITLWFRLGTVMYTPGCLLMRNTALSPGAINLLSFHSNYHGNSVLQHGMTL